jgi:hypothetical protein
MTVEGVPTAKVAMEFAHRCGLDLPIFTAVQAIVSGELKIEVYLLFFPRLLLILMFFLGCSYPFNGKTGQVRISE